MYGFDFCINFGLIQLESAVAEEMKVFKQEWESQLDELEAESAQLLVTSNLWAFFN